MLNLIRENRYKLKWLLWLVIIGLTVGMVLLFSAAPPSAPGQELGNFVAKVDGVEISPAEFRFRLKLILNRLGPNATTDKKKLKMYGQYVLNSLVRTTILSIEAKKVGFTVSDKELRDYILNSPLFNMGGSFVGAKDYERILSYLGITPEGFENLMRKEILSQKYTDFLNSSVKVGNNEVKQLFEENNNSAKIRYVAISDLKYFSKVDMNPEKIKEYYEKHKKDFKVGETRVVKYIKLSSTALERAMLAEITDDEALNYIKQHPREYPEMVGAKHILFKVPKNATPAEVEKIKKKAEKVLKMAKSGVDFSKLAKKYSEDPGSAKRGGDLGFFGRGRMVKPFEDAAFSLKVGQISNLVRTQFGFHIIKVTAKKDAKSYIPQAKRKLAREKAKDQLQNKAQEIYDELQKSKDIDSVAKKFNLKVEMSKPINRKNPDYKLGMPKGFIDELMSMKKVGEVGNLYEVYDGFFVYQLNKIIKPHIPSLNEIKAKVEGAYRRFEAIKLAQQKCKEFLSKVKKPEDFDKVAKSMKLNPEDSFLFNVKGQVSKDLGYAFGLTYDVLKHKVNELGGPVNVKDKEVAYIVKERNYPDESKFEKSKDTLKLTLENTRKTAIRESVNSKLYRTYIREKKIIINQKLVDVIIG